MTVQKDTTIPPFFPFPSFLQNFICSRCDGFDEFSSIFLIVLRLPVRPGFKEALDASSYARAVLLFFLVLRPFISPFPATFSNSIPYRLSTRFLSRSYRTPPPLLPFPQYASVSFSKSFLCYFLAPRLTALVPVQNRISALVLLAFPPSPQRKGNLCFFALFCSQTFPTLLQVTRLHVFFVRRLVFLMKPFKL